jgi:hypothetical protein
LAGLDRLAGDVAPVPSLIYQFDILSIGPCYSSRQRGVTGIFGRDHARLERKRGGTTMTRVTRGQKIYFAAVGLLALWVGIWGSFFPTRVDTAIPWLVPPLHARFLGALYFSAVVFTVGSMLARYYAEVRIVVPVIAIWTGLLFLISLFYLGEFDYRRGPVWFWFGSYFLYPLIGIWLIWHDRSRRETIAGPRLPLWGRRYLLMQGVIVTTLALALLLTPDFMVNVWPWKITRLLAQIYASPLLAYGVSSLVLSRKQAWLEVRVFVISAFVFACGVLLASLIHRGLFSSTNAATWLWFGGFLLAAVMLGVLSLLSIRAGSAT